MLTGNGVTPLSSHDRSTLVDDIVELLGQIMRNTKHQFHRTGDLLVFDLTMSQLRAALVLEDRPIPMRRLADALGVSLPSATGLVDRLVERGLVSRHEDLEDRRLVLCALTEKGRGLVTSLYECDRVITEAVLADLSTQELQVVHDAFALLNKAAAVQLERIAQEAAAEAALLSRSQS